MLGCRGLGRVDLLLDVDDRLWVLEVNSIPGMTDTSLLPKVQTATGTEVSLRTLQRYGEEELHAKDKHSKKRTAQERECNCAYSGPAAMQRCVRGR